MSVSKKVLAAFAGASLVFALGACSSERAPEKPAAPGATDTDKKDPDATGGGLIGVLMPTRSLERWNNDGDHLEALLKDAGYEVSLQFADNKVDQQITQIDNLVNLDPKVLVVASIDGEALAPALEAASAKGITIIAYDRLINGTEAVDYYATFDNYKVGQLQGEFIVEQLDLENADGPFNLEPFAGSPDDNNAKFFFSGAWDILLPYIESGKLVVPSGKSPKSNDDWQTIGIAGWTSAAAQSEMDNRLNAHYADKKLDVILSPNDSLALGIAQSLTSANYKPGDNWPILTGQDADEASVLNILADKQSMTVWKDTRTLGDQVAKMVDQIVRGEEVTVNDTETYDNGKRVVPSYLLPPEVVVKDTVQSALVDSKFHSAEALGL